MIEDVSHSLNNYNIRSNPPTNMSVKEASFYLGISERKLRESIARHDVKHVRFGSRIILRKQDLDSFIEGMVA
jgi:excisionase family DNA binding protein